MKQIKLTTITRRDLSAGYQSVQSTHAAIQFVFEHPEIANIWFKDPYLAQLSVENEDALKHLIHKLQKNDIKYSIFREPDLGNEITAIAIEPSDKARRMLSYCPLMLKEYRDIDKIFNKVDKNSYQEKEKEDNYV